MIQPDLELAASLFDALSRATRRGRGIVRDSYGEGEQAAHDLMRSAASTLGLEIAIDALGNLFMTLPGQDRAAPRIILGSHLDSVPQGGNYDGAAGVVAGLCALSALRRAALVPGCDLSVRTSVAAERLDFSIRTVSRLEDPTTERLSRRRCGSVGSIRSRSASASDCSTRRTSVPTWSCTSSRARHWSRRDYLPRS